MDNVDQPMSLIARLHRACKQYAGDEDELRSAIGNLMADYGRDVVVSAMVDCLNVSYSRLRHAPNMMVDELVAVLGYSVIPE